MNKYKYIGETSPFVRKGQILEQEPTIWSIKKVNSDERETVKVLYVKDFNGGDTPINIDKFELVK